MAALDIFRVIGLTDDDEIKGALEAFSKEYANLTKDQENAVSIGINELTHVALPRKPLGRLAINLLGDILIKSSFKGAVAPGSVLSGLKQRFLGDSSPTDGILKKISRMIKAEGVEGFETVKDYARIAAHVYGNRENSILPESWVSLGSKFENMVLDDEKSGLHAALYTKSGTKTEYVYAIAGTKGADIKDWMANIGQVAGISDQYDRAGEIAVKLSEELGKENLTIVGHSKGGGQAAYCALKTECHAITFNPAGLGLYKFNHDLDIKPEINSYVMVTDPLNLMQMLAQFFYVDLTADGSVHYLKCDKISSMRDLHGIDGFLRLGGMNNMHRLMD